MTDIEIALCRVLAVVWDAFVDGMGIDAMDLESVLDHSSLALWQPATEEDVRAHEGLELEVGDMLLKLTDEGRRLVQEGRRFRREQPNPP